MSPLLAPHDATPLDEVARLLGAPFESVTLQRRRSAHAAAVLHLVGAIRGQGKVVKVELGESGSTYFVKPERATVEAGKVTFNDRPPRRWRSAPSLRSS